MQSINSIKGRIKKIEQVVQPQKGDFINVQLVVVQADGSRLSQAEMENFTKLKMRFDYHYRGERIDAESRVARGETVIRADIFSIEEYNKLLALEAKEN